MAHFPKLTQTFTTDLNSYTVDASRLNTANFVETSNTGNYDFTISANIDKSDVDEGGYWLMEVINMVSNTAMVDQPKQYVNYNTDVTFTGVELRNPATQGDILVKMGAWQYETESARDGVISTQNPSLYVSSFIGNGATTDFYRNFEIRVDAEDPTGNTAADSANTSTIVSNITGSADEGLSEYIRLVANAKTVVSTLKEFGEGSDASEAADNMMEKLLELLDVYLGNSGDTGLPVRNEYNRLSQLIIDGVNAGTVPRFEVFTKRLFEIFEVSIFERFEDTIEPLQNIAEEEFKTSVEELGEKLYDVTVVLDKGSTIVTARFYDDVYTRINQSESGINSTVDAIQQYDNGSLPLYIEADAVAATNAVITLADQKIISVAATATQVNNKFGDMIITLQDIVDRYGLE